MNITYQARKTTREVAFTIVTKDHSISPLSFTCFASHDMIGVYCCRGRLYTVTIAISLKVNDGLVLAADSASTLITQEAAGTISVANVYNNANKIFNLRKGLPIGAITWGAGNIGTASTYTLMKDLRRRLSGEDSAYKQWAISEPYQIESIAQKVRKFFFEEMYQPTFKDSEQKPQVGFIVAGYSSGESMAEEYQINIANGICEGPSLLRPKSDTGVTWNGEPEAVTRLMLGFSPLLPQVLIQNLGVPQEQVGPAIDVLRQALTAPLVIPAMPFQDAIDLAEFLVNTTIQFSRFFPGPPTVGGPIEVAAISKHEGFKWIRRKHYYSRELNPEDK